MTKSGWRISLFFSLLIFGGNPVLSMELRKLAAIGPQPTAVSPQGVVRPLYENSYALLISVGQYLGVAKDGWKSLNQTKGEMDDVAVALQQHGFNVWRVHDPNGQELFQIYRDFIAAYGYKPDNRLIFFFSGHGYTTDKGFGYLVPTDAADPKKSMGGFASKALPIQQLELWARELEVRHALFLFDSCFSGSIFSNKGPANSLGPVIDGSADRWRFLSGQSAKPVRQFIAAGDAKEELPSSSVFIPLLIQALNGAAARSGDKYITGKEIGLWIEHTLPSFSRKQTPHSDVIRVPELAFGDMVFQLNESTKNVSKTAEAQSPIASVEVGTPAKGAPVSSKSAVSLYELTSSKIPQGTGILNMAIISPDNKFAASLTENASGIAYDIFSVESGKFVEKRRISSLAKFLQSKDSRVFADGVEFSPWGSGIYVISSDRGGKDRGFDRKFVSMHNGERNISIEVDKSVRGIYSLANEMEVLAFTSDGLLKHLNLNDGKLTSFSTNTVEDTAACRTPTHLFFHGANPPGLLVVDRKTMVQQFHPFAKREYISLGRGVLCEEISQSVLDAWGTTLRNAMLTRGSARSERGGLSMEGDQHVVALSPGGNFGLVILPIDVSVPFGKREYEALAITIDGGKIIWRESVGGLSFPRVKPPNIGSKLTVGWDSDYKNGKWSYIIKSYDIK